MAETEAITVATTSDGVGGSGDPGKEVDLPVVELLTGRGFITGKSGSGKSNTASVVAEKLLDNGFGLLVVDIDGEYYGLKEEYEILHVGADEECDIQVTVEHAEKIASLALEQNVPIILDISSFLDQEEAEELLTEVARQLFAKAKKQKQPFLMLVEECHEWIPEKGSVGEVGQMLIKIGKRGRKHGLGMVGISQRPADVKKDYITQCDWLVWHRLTWNNDTKVVSRIIDREYADAVEDLDDGEAFLMTDWSETIRRVQFHRKQTFDAGATPGLDDFERPELKSVSEDLVSELETISEERAATESRVTELREELDRKNSRIAELEAELQDARDLSRMAEQFTEALVSHVEGYNPGRTEKERMRKGLIDASDDAPADPRERDGAGAREGRADGERGAGDDEGDPTDGTSGGGFGDAFGMFADEGPAISGGAGANGAGDGESDGDGDAAADPERPDAATAADGAGGASVEAGGRADPESAPPTDGGIDGELSFKPADFTGGRTAAIGDAPDGGQADVDGATPQYLRALVADVNTMEEKSRRMLAHYVEQGPDTPLNAHFSAGGTGDRTDAYAHNRRLRLAGFVEHVGRGRYETRLQALIRKTAPNDPGPNEVADAVAHLERSIRSA